MNRKDIALTVGGVLATMALAYMFYRLQQRDAAAAVTTSATATDSGVVTSTDPYAQYYQEAAYTQSLPSISIPTIGTSVDTSANTALTGITTTGNSPTSATDPNNLLSQVIAAYAGNTGATNPNLLPTYTVNDPYSAVVANIPTTAAQATAGTGTLSYPASMVSNSTVTSHPVTAHPIVTTGT